MSTMVTNGADIKDAMFSTHYFKIWMNASGEYDVVCFLSLFALYIY